MSSVIEMIKKELVDNGADGLCTIVENVDCGCSIEDLFSCLKWGDMSDEFLNCVAAKNNPERALMEVCEYWMEPIQ